MKIRGHTFVWTALTTLSREGRLPHALLFSGPEGIGKKQLARLFAQYLLCENPKSSQEACSSCHHCQLFLKGSYPDFYSLDAAAKETSPEQLRELLSRLELHAFEGGLRIILLDNVERMTSASANLLLKNLEEPRPGTLFILITSSLLKVLTTIRSRCQQWSFSELSPNDMTEILREHIGDDSDSPTPELAAFLLGGSLTLLPQLKELNKRYHLLRPSLAAILSGDAAKAYSLAETVSKDKEGGALWLHLLRICTRKALLQSQNILELQRLEFFLSNLLECDRLLTERHLARSALFQFLFLSLAGSKSLPPLDDLRLARARL